MPDPTVINAVNILRAIRGGEVAEVRRFPNGLAHFVYDVTTTGDERLVIRLTRPEQRGDFAGALYWHSRLRSLDVPLPRLFHAELNPRVHGFPVLILERLPGVDLGDCYASLIDEQKRRIARQIVEFQTRVATLEPGQGFGYAHSPNDPALCPTWRDVLEQSLERSRQWFRTAGVLSEEPVDRVACVLSRFDAYFARVQPTCFLHDTTTKNVLIHNGKLSGIVDVDSVCYGDPLWVLSLTNMAMQSMNADRVYVDAWADTMRLDREQRAVLGLYTAMHCVTFLGELGQQFNQDVPLPVDPARVAQLHRILDDLLAEV